MFVLMMGMEGYSAGIHMGVDSSINNCIFNAQYQPLC